MAPRAGARRNQSQSEEIFELGKQGRKTGVTIRDTGDRDEYDMQPLDALNSSPEKTDTVRFNFNSARTPSVTGAQHSENDDDDSDDDFPMDIENTTAPDPARLMNGIKMPLPRARSPAKTFLQSPAHKNPHLGPSSSPTRGSIVEQRARDGADLGLSPKRRLDFGLNSASRPVLKPTRTSPRTTRKQSRDEEDEDEAILQGQENTTIVAEESMVMIEVGDDIPAVGDDDDVELGEDSRVEDSPQTDNHSAAKRTARKSSRMSESILDETADIPEPEPEAEEEEEEAAEEQVLTPQPSPKQSKKRGRPPAKPAAVVQREEKENKPPLRAAKRHRSNNAVEEEHAEPAEPVSKKARGRPRGRPADLGKRVLSPPDSGSGGPARKPKGKAGRPPKVAARRSESPAAGADTSLAVIPRGPPLPKSRGLLIKRRVELPGSNDGILRTRSGRNSFKPLAYWRNEHVDYDQDAVTDDITVRGGKSNSRILVPAIKGIHRIDEEEAPKKPKSYHKSAKHSSSSKYTTKTPNPNAFFDPEPAEAWEAEDGHVVGDVIAWKSEYDFSPPALTDEVDVEPEELAVSGRSIQTREIRNATFRFAKTLNTPFFGAGVVDLPPGAEKRPKNARKMYMSFFVFAGRVAVKVNDTEFRISRGGMWFVPRGNTYSIKNDYDEPARVFFSQGCERMESEDTELAE
ncbi:cupin domain-containing protein [Coniochaeta sp. 2T2.1]|nr:cupin domain-containing protein [Coniochaeta sp. 2T2.1]